MAVLKIRDSNGNVQEILAIKGDKGEKGADGTMTFEDLTPEQKESLKGEKGDKGDKGEPGESPTPEDIISQLPTEEWVFTLSDGSKIKKKVVVI